MRLPSPIYRAMQFVNRYFLSKPHDARLLTWGRRDIPHLFHDLVVHEAAVIEWVLQGSIGLSPTKRLFGEQIIVQSDNCQLVCRHMQRFPELHMPLTDVSPSRNAVIVRTLIGVFGAANSA